MMEDKFDKIKQALNKEVPEWDSATLWDNIEGELPEETRKRRRFFIWIFFGIFFSGVLTWFYVSNNNIESNDYKHNVIDSKTNFIKSEKINNQDISLNTVISENQPPKSEQKSTNETSHEIAEGKSSNSLKPESKKPKFNGQKKNDKLQLNTPDHQMNETINHGKETILIEINPSIPAKVFFQSSGIDTIEDEPIKQNVSIEYASPLMPIPTRMIWNPGTNLRRTTKLGLSDFIVEGANKEKGYTLEELKDVSTSKNLLKINVGLAYTFRSLNSNLHSNWDSSRNTYETPVESYSIDIEYEHRLKKRMSLAIGLQWNQTNELFEHIDTSVQSEIMFSDTGVMHGNLFLPGELTEHTYTYKRYNWPNKYQSLNIPVTLYYQLMKHNSQFLVGIGVNNQVWFKYDGYILNLQSEISNKVSDIGVHFKQTRWFSSLHSNLVYRRILKNWSWHIGMGGEFGLRSISENFDQRFHRVGLRAGVAYLINNK